MIPDSMSLREARQHMLENPALDDVLGMIQLGRTVRIRFLLTATGSELPDGELWGNFRLMTARGEAHISIDDRGGGLRQRTPEPEPA